MDLSTVDFPPKNANHKIRRLLGRAYLRENRIPEALEVYLGILKDDPNDVDALFILGTLYRLSGNARAAGQLFRRVLEINPGDHLAETQAALVKEEDCLIDEAGGPVSSKAIENLGAQLQTLHTPEFMDAIRAAADERTGEMNGQPLEDVQQLMPALIELNIRQARAAGYPDLAEALQSLQIHLTRQVDDHWADDLLREENPPESSHPEDV